MKKLKDIFFFQAVPSENFLLLDAQITIKFYCVIFIVLNYKILFSVNI